MLCCCIMSGILFHFKNAVFLGDNENLKGTNNLSINIMLSGKFRAKSSRDGANTLYN